MSTEQTDRTENEQSLPSDAARVVSAEEPFRTLTATAQQVVGLLNDGQYTKAEFEARAFLVLLAGAPVLVAGYIRAAESSAEARRDERWREALEDALRSLESIRRRCQSPPPDALPAIERFAADALRALLGAAETPREAQGAANPGTSNPEER